MRIHGNLVKWDDERGFGFVLSPQNSDKIFVHISSFPRDGTRPKVGELISFEIDTKLDGKKSAVKVIRPGSHASKKNSLNRRGKNSIFPLRLIVTIILVLFFIYTLQTNHIYQQIPQPSIPKNITSVSITKSPKFKCDGRQYCNQMTSREEAEYFIRNCPNTKMDGDFDGVPCENDQRF
jgi:cold shock CspA family protein